MIQQHSDDYTSLMEEGPKYIRADQNDLQTQSLRQQMEDVRLGWQELQVLWDTRKALLEQSMNYQVASLYFFHPHNVRMICRLFSKFWGLFVL